MGVKVKKLRGSYYIQINFKGQRKTKKVGGTLESARNIAKKVEAKLIMGDLGIISDDKAVSPLVSEYAERWLEKHIQVTTKPATYAQYSQLMKTHILPRYGHKRVDAITPEHVEDFVYLLVTKKENGACVYAQRTIGAIIGCLRSFYTYAVKNQKAKFNPAAKLGKIARSDKPEREIESMTQRESELFLGAVADLFPERYPLFLTAFSTGMRRGELLGLKWGDCAFGEDEKDPNRYFLVSRRFTAHGFGTPKTPHSKRRVDMSKNLRTVLMAARDETLIAAMMEGKESIADELLFLREDGEALTPRTLSTRFMEPACQQAGIRTFTPHALRHTFAVLMLQSGASLKYVSEQMGHSSIKITADVYGKLQPGANIGQIDRLNFGSQQNANGAQTRGKSRHKSKAENIDLVAVRGNMPSREHLIAY
jgi:integrase